MQKASGHRGENKRQQKKSEQVHIKRVTRSFWKFLVVVVRTANGNVPKECAARAKFFFC